MPEQRPVRERVIDRQRERELFATVLAEAAGPRLITVQAESGAGKSWLLELLEDMALAADPPCATVRARLGNDPQLIWLMGEIAAGLGACGAPLERFEERNFARITCDHRAFGLPDPPAPVIHASTTISNSHLQDSPTTTTGAEIAAWPSGWPDGHELAAQTKCLDAALDDLRDISRSRTVVVMLDQYERAGDAIRQWLHRALMTRVFHEPEAFGRLIMMVASTTPAFPMLPRLLGARSDEVLHPIDGLSRWGDEDIADWLELMGIAKPAVWVPAIRSLIDDDGATPQTLKMVAAEVIAAREGARS